MRQAGITADMGIITKDIMKPNITSQRLIMRLRRQFIMTGVRTKDWLAE
jgi:hypothetical protein